MSESSWVPVPARLAIVALFLLAGCVAEPTSGFSHDPALFPDTLAEARASDTSAAQLAQLEQAEAAGEVTLEAAREAARRTVECQQLAGLTASLTEQEHPSGLVLPGYEVATESDAAAAAADACAMRESHWVSLLYQLQPSSLQLAWDFLERQAPAIRQCLAEAGHPAPEGGTTKELAEFASLVTEQTHGATDCLGDVGATGY